MSNTVKHAEKNKTSLPQSAGVTSFWEAQESRRQKSKHLTRDIHIDIAILGGGFTGLSTAREIKKDDSALEVAIFEAKYVGYGASGRNGGFNMSLFGLEPEVTLWRWGQQKTIEAQNYLNQAVSYVQDLVKTYDIKSDYEHNGMVRVAYSDAQLKRLEHSLELFEKLGVWRNYVFQPEAEIQSSIHSPKFRAGIFEASSGTLNPYKHVLELMRIAKQFGAKVYENTPVLNIERAGTYIKLTTPDGIVTCNKLVIAANAWSSQIKGLPRIRTRQAPVWTSQVVTQVLSDQHWGDIGWNDRQSIEDNRQLLHYFRRTACGRFTMGGGNVAFPKKHAIGTMDTACIWENLEAHIKWLFPTLQDIKIDYKWGGPVSVNLDMTPEIGFIGDERIIYANGCIGHGVSLTQLNGRTIADLALEKKTELTDFWIINRKAIPWPQGMVGNGTMRVITGGLRLWDKIEERKLIK